MPTPPDLLEVIHDVFDPIEALEGTIETARSMPGTHGPDLVPRAVAEVAIRHSFRLAGDPTLKADFRARAEAATGMEFREILALAEGT